MSNVNSKPLVISQEVSPAFRYSIIEFLAHIIHIRADSIFDVILLPVEGRMDIDVPFLMQKAVCGLYAVF